MSHDVSTPTAAVTPPLGTRRVVEETLALSDGQRMFYRAWLSDQSPPNKALMLFHRGHEHSGRFDDVVGHLKLPDDVAIFAPDARGHGQSEGDRGYAPSFAQVVRDIDTFVRFICEKHAIAIQDVAVLGHSVGGVALAAWVHDYAPPVRAMALVTPALRVKLYVPLALPALRLLRRLKRGGKSFVKSYVKARMLTHDPAQADRYDADPLIARQIAVNILLDLHDTSTRLLSDAGAIVAPTLLLSAGKDWVVKFPPQKRLLDRLSSPIKRMRHFDDMHHDLLHEADQASVVAMIRGFLLERFAAPPPSRNELLHADRAGFTHDEYETLRHPLPAWSFKRWSLAIQRLLMRTLGRLSDGISLGWRTGFSSGQTLDYVYQNHARGLTPIGRAVDRVYLNSVGWRGIRQRKVNLQIALRRVILQLRRDGQPVRLLDVASGSGRYVFDTLATISDANNVHVHLRDFNASNLAAASDIAASMGLKNVRTQVADAFDESLLASTSPSPNVAIVSGLYELFPDNDKIIRSLRGIARAMRSGGYLIYTGQPWHPQIEMIARVLFHGDGSPWIMRRRTQAELDVLVESAGFVKQSTDIDDFGIFTVSVARRVKTL